MTCTFVRDGNEIDLDQHAFIEASAGTGKTYTIEHLVVRLLVERPDIELENILLVTFTEKATSELKQRIQEKLESRMNEAAGDTQLLKKLKATLDAFDKASIYTIHGFCQTVLRDFAFENGALFSHEVIDDGPLFTTLLKEQMRRDWPAVYGRTLPVLMALSGFSRKKDRFLNLVTGLARTIRSGSGDEIHPLVGGPNAEQRLARIEDGLSGLKSLVTPVFCEAFELLNLKKAPKEAMRALLEELSATSWDISRLARLLLDLDTFGTDSSENPWPKNRKKNLEVCPGIETVIAVVGPLVEDCRVLSHMLIVHSLERLKADAALIKKQNGWISYDDMISRLKSAVEGPDAEGLLDRLRRKYAVAFVDEFQDTDADQWAIFSRIFLDAPADGPGNRLYLIGDPKQAIYAFRGADVFVYLDARKRMVALADQGRARLYSLAVNWRSQPELIRAFNRLFVQKPWFMPGAQAGSFDIGYQDVGFPDENKRPEILETDSSNRPSLVIMDISRSLTSRRVKSDLADVITREIRHLLGCGTMTIRTINGSVRPLDYGDICILVRGKRDFLALEPLMLSRNIPVTYYKKPGLFFSEEALFLSVLFHAVLDPSDRVSVRKALLTPFFDVAGDQLPFFDHQNANHPIKQLLAVWNAFALERQWSRLFQSIMEDSGLIFRRSKERDWDRRQTNYSQIFEHLNSAAYRKNLDFRGMSALLDSYRKQTADADEDGDIHQIETEDRKVQVMTMHVSKGLQFPVVFVAGGLGGGMPPEVHMFHRYDETNPSQCARKVIDLTLCLDKDCHAREALDEDKRLFYVALTRARFKLYIPRYAPSERHRLRGPVVNLLTPCIDAAVPRSHPASEVMWLEPGKPLSSPSDAWVDCSSREGGLHGNDGIGPLPRSADHRARRDTMASFSSLHSRSGQADDTRFHAQGVRQWEDDERHTGVPVASAPTPRTNELPGGTDTGSMLHDILETIDFQNVADHPDALLLMASTRNVIEKNMERYGMAPGFREEVAHIVATTLTTPMTVSGKPFMLCHLKPGDRLHEVEFYFPMPDMEPCAIPGMETRKGRRGFIRGFIDLIFQVDGKFYIADWKSNRLSEGYGQASLEQSMADAGYDLQYKIYTLATLRWLGKRLGSAFDPASHFGGIYYFFLRGMAQNEGHGIYHVPPEAVGHPGDLEREIMIAAGK